MVGRYPCRSIISARSWSGKHLGRFLSSTRTSLCEDARKENFGECSEDRNAGGRRRDGGAEFQRVGKKTGSGSYKTHRAQSESSVWFRRQEEKTCYKQIERYLCMMAFVHEQSYECTKSELDLFSVPPTQTSMEHGTTLDRISSADDSKRRFAYRI